MITKKQRDEGFRELSAGKGDAFRRVQGPVDGTRGAGATGGGAGTGPLG